MTEYKIKKELGKAFRQGLVKFKNQVFKRKNIRYFLYYAVGNFVILLLYSLYETTQQTVSLSLKPTIGTGEVNLFIYVLTAIVLPLEILFEEIGFRFLPMFFVEDIFHLNTITISVEDKTGIHTVQNSRLRVWLYHNWFYVFLIISGLWAAWFHQLNIVESSSVGSLIYFGVQLYSGLSLAWIYARRGLGASWIVHVGWDLFLVVLDIVLLLL